MKTNSRNISVTLLLCATLIAQYSCKKDKNDESFVDGYNPTLTEKAGITYDGDYFPLNTGYNWVLILFTKHQKPMALNVISKKLLQPSI